jgi:sugar phosphate permease
VSTIVVTGPTTSTTAFQLTATAKFSDGTTQDVTSKAAWQSSNAAIASVASTGMVTIVGSGTVMLQATYQSVIGSIQTSVTKQPPPMFQLSGSVWEVDPNAHKIAGAAVIITAGANSGQSVVSDVNGNYVFPAVTSGVVSLIATMNGYITPSPEGINLSADTQADVYLAPVPPQDANGNTATARCVDKSWSWAVTRSDACAANGGIEYPVCPGPLCPSTFKGALARRR